MLQVKEVFGPTLQGEGDCAGLPSIFIRFAGCNMWNGRLKDRHKSACPYCDTDFINGRGVAVKDLVNDVLHIAKDELEKYIVVLTGGEPFLQDHELLNDLKEELYRAGCPMVQIETNGTKHVPSFLGKQLHIVCSPKVDIGDLEISLETVNCWKILHPHPTIDLDQWLRLPHLYPSSSYYLQPIETQMPESFTRSGMQANKNISETVIKVMETGHPWKLSLQQHKMLGLK